MKIDLRYVPLILVTLILVAACDRGAVPSAEGVYAPFYAFFLVGPTALLVEMEGGPTTGTTLKCPLNRSKK